MSEIATGGGDLTYVGGNYTRHEYDARLPPMAVDFSIEASPLGGWCMAFRGYR